MPNEEKTVKITVDKGEIGKVSVNIWNGDNIIVEKHKKYSRVPLWAPGYILLVTFIHFHSNIF
jgi:hypothetical protein